MKILHKSLILSVVILLPIFAMAQNGELTFGAQYKARYEFRNGFKRPILESENPASFVEQRARIWANFQNENFQIKINIQDVRMWGMNNQIYKSDNALFNTYEAYGAFFINPNWTLQVGRQALDYDNARFLGNLDWAMQGRSHDALLIKYTDTEKNFKLHLAASINQAQFEPGYLVQQPYPRGNYKNMVFLWANKSWGDLSSSFLIHNDGRESIDDSTGEISNNYRQTFGIIPSYKADNVSLNGEFYYQMGKNGAGQDVAAMFAALYVKFNTDLTPIIFGFDYATGTQYDADANTDNSWNPLYGTNHKFYGFMDYFYVGNGHGQAGGRAAGLVDINLKTNFKMNEKNFIAVHLHQFMTPVDIQDLNNPGTTLSSTLGTEIDIVYKVVLAKGLVGNIGYSQMFASESMNHIKPMNGAPLENTGMNNWAWVQLNFSGDLFKVNK